MFTKILIPLDGTLGSEAAMLPAVEVAKRFDADVVLLEVTPGYGQLLGATAAEQFGSQGSVAAAAEVAVAAETAASAYLDAIRSEYGNLRWQTIVAEGNSADAIVEQARALDVNLIVMATHARSGLKRLFIGSVAEDVIRKCGIPVLVVHADDSDEE